MKDLLKYYDLEKFGLSTKRNWKSILATACLKFLYLTVFEPEMPLAKLNALVLSANFKNERLACNCLFENLLMHKLLAFDTYNQDIYAVLNSSQEGQKLFEMISESVSEFEDFTHRISYLTIPPEIKGILEKKKVKYKD